MTIPPEAATQTLQNPFAVLTIIAAPAILTNAASILTLSTSTRLISVANRIKELSEKINQPDLAEDLKTIYLKQVSRSQRQSEHFLQALRSIYLSLGCFAVAAFVAIVGAAALRLLPTGLIDGAAILSLATGGVGVLGFVWAGWHLIQASRITVLIINDDIEHLKKTHSLSTA